MISTHMLLKKSAISDFMYSLRASSTVVLVTRLLVPSTTPSRLTVTSPSTVPAAMGAVSVSPSRSLYMTTSRVKSLTLKPVLGISALMEDWGRSVACPPSPARLTWTRVTISVVLSTSWVLKFSNTQL